VRAVKLWSLLPRDVNMQKESENFKILLGIFMDSIPDTPPSPNSWIHGKQLKLYDRLLQPERWSADGLMTLEMPSSKLLNRFNR
jgi:hypothetical protein